MSTDRKQKYLHEAYTFEDNVGYLLRYIQVPNSSESMQSRARNLLWTVIQALSTEAELSLRKRKEITPKAEWIKELQTKVHASRLKLKADKKRFLAAVPERVRLKANGHA